MTRGIHRDLLVGRRWAFGQPDAEPHARQMLLLEEGGIGGYVHPNERSWRLDGSDLLLVDANGIPTTRFSSVVERDGRIRLEGRFLAADIPHVLDEVPPIGVPAGPALAIDPERVRPDRNRRFLVIVRGGGGSLHPEWLDGLSEQDRSWDLCLSHFAREIGEARSSCDLFVHQSDVGKFAALHRLLHPASPLWNYSHIMLADDDMRMTGRDLNRLFARMREHDLLIAQPALSPESYVMHDLTRVRPEAILRYTCFVEMMVPVFASWVLALVVPSFGGLTLGYGLDHLWSFLIGRPRGRIAIVDDVVVTHTRPPQANYDREEAEADERLVQGLYGFLPDYTEYGRLIRDP